MKQGTMVLSKRVLSLTRQLHTNHNLQKPTLINSQPTSISESLPSLDSKMVQKPPLATLPFSSVLRSYLITMATSSPVLLAASFAMIKRALDPNSRLLSIDHNPLLKSVFKKTFYAQFCAGENIKEVQKTIRELKDAGYKGVILEYALEVLKGEGSGNSTAQDIETWRKGMLDTVEMCSAGDVVGLKWSGLGQAALELLDEGKSPTLEMEKAIQEACDMASAKKVALMPAAELEVTNVGIDAWTMNLQRKYNKSPNQAIMYTTYQAYLASTPQRMARDLAIAQREGFTLGIKLVRGAYLKLEEKSAVMGSKAESDRAYDKLLEAILKRQYNDYLKAPETKVFPNVALMIATHNAQSIETARRIRNEQAEKSQPRIECGYAQLQGMADEVSCELIAGSKAVDVNNAQIDIPRPFKCASWGTVSQCLNFLYRRALENQDAASRTKETRDAMAGELWRRCKVVFGGS
jgi:hypothetical protein